MLQQFLHLLSFIKDNYYFHIKSHNIVLPKQFNNNFFTWTVYIIYSILTFNIKTETNADRKSSSILLSFMLAFVLVLDKKTCPLLFENISYSQIYSYSQISNEIIATIMLVQIDLWNRNFDHVFNFLWSATMCLLDRNL